MLTTTFLVAKKKQRSQGTVLFVASETTQTHLARLPVSYQGTVQVMASETTTVCTLDVTQPGGGQCTVQVMAIETTSLGSGDSDLS